MNTAVKEKQNLIGKVMEAFTEIARKDNLACKIDTNLDPERATMVVNYSPIERSIGERRGNKFKLKFIGEPTYNGKFLMTTTPANTSIESEKGRPEDKKYLERVLQLVSELGHETGYR